MTTQFSDKEIIKDLEGWNAHLEKHNLAIETENEVLKAENARLRAEITHLRDALSAYKPKPEPDVKIYEWGNPPMTKSGQFDDGDAKWLTPAGE